MRDEFLTYDAADFAAEEDFLSWVKSGFQRHDEEWRRWLEAHPEKKAAIEEAQDLVLSLRFEVATPATDTSRLWSRIQDTIREEQPPVPIKAGRRRSLRVVFAALGAAASVAILIFAALHLWNTHSIATPRGEHRTYTLPDRSQVTLNADSRIRFRAGGWAERREVSLLGEAFFEVEKGVPFVVTTPLGQVEVLGTSFNVFSREAILMVQCRTGRVAVTSKGDAAGVILEPGEQCALDTAGKLVKSSLGADSEAAWQQGIYRFEARPLTEVFSELERQFDVNIQLPEETAGITFTGSFRGEDLDAALDAVCWPLGLTANKEGATIVISKEPTAE